MKELTHIPLDQLNVASSDLQADPGELRAVVNAVPLGPVGNHYWSPAEGATAVGLLSGVLSLGVHVRQQYGDWSDLAGDPNQSLERLVAITEGGIYLVDPGQDYAHKEIHTFAEVDATRRAQFSQLGDVLIIAIARGAGIGGPGELLMLRDDQIFEYAFPTLPLMNVVTTDSVAAGEEAKLDRGTYSFRWAWILKDGTIGPPSRPLVRTFGTADPVGTRYLLRFYINWYPTALPAAWEELISGIACFMSEQVEIDSENSDAPINKQWYQVATLSGLAVNDKVLWSDLAENIPTYELLNDELLLQHQIKAASCYSYNHRAIIGDVEYDYRRPVLEHEVAWETSYDDGGASFWLMLAVDIRTAQGTLTRYSNVRAIDFAHKAVSMRHDFVSYPDVRAERWRLYVSTDYATAGNDPNLATWAECWPTDEEIGRFTRGSGNFAYQRTKDLSIDVSTLTPSLTLDVSGAHAKFDRDANRMLTSSVGRPLELLARRVEYVGDSSDDGIVGFATNAMPVSPGQFGDYPLYVLGQETVSMGRPGAGDVAWDGFETIAKRGCVGRAAFCNIDQAIAIISRDGVWMLNPDPDPEPISWPIHYNNARSDFFGCIGAGAAAGYYNDKQRGRRELWVAIGQLVFGYSFQHRRWFILDRVRSGFLLHDNVPYGINYDGGAIVHEGGSTDPVFIYVRTTRQHLGAVGVTKRLRKIMIRQRLRLDALQWRIVDLDEQGHGRQVARGKMTRLGADVANLPCMAVAPYVEVFGDAVPGEGLEGIGFEYEYRWPHRKRTTKPLELDPSDLYQYVLVEVPWSCSTGFDEDVIKNRPPELYLENIEWAPALAPYSNFSDVRLRLENDPIYWELPDEVEIPVHVEEQTAPYAAFNDVDLQLTNRPPQLVLDNVQAFVSANAAPTWPTSAAGGHDIMLDGYAGVQSIVAIAEDSDGQIHSFVFKPGQAGTPWTIDSVHVDGWNGSAWVSLGARRSGSNYYNTTTGYTKKRFTIQFDPDRQVDAGIGPYVAALEATDDGGKTTGSGLNVSVQF